MNCDHVFSIHRLFRRPSAAPLLIILLLPAAARAEETLSRDDVDRLVQLLDDDSFARREAATGQLIQLGEQVIPFLQPATESSSAEVRYRARSVIDLIVRRQLDKQFSELASRENDADIDVERGMYLIAKLVDPTACRAQLSDELDRLAQAVRDELGEDVDPAQLPPREAVAVLQKILFQDYGFQGNTDNYDHPDNSSLQRVLKTRQGLPILLSHIVIAVARRLEIPIVGLALPGRYKCKYDGARALGGQADDIIIDPFGEGRILTNDDLREIVIGFDPTEDLAADTNRAAIDRMLRNLISDCYAINDTRLARRAQKYQAMFAAP